MDKSKPPMYEHLTGHFISASVQKRNSESKGGGMEFTPSGNILIGPSAVEVPYKEDVETTSGELDFIMRINENPQISKADIIRIFAGARPADYSEDFVIGMSPVAHGLINAGAIQSPGVGASPAVAEMVENILLEDAGNIGFKIDKKKDFNPIRKKKVKFSELTREAQDKLIAERPEYGRVICRCETVTEGEILDAIHSPVVPTSIDAIKRRTRAGMGRCQGGFCQPRVLEILARELGLDWVEVNLNRNGTNVLKHDSRRLKQNGKGDED
jgi:glycerol-3-phosphate dehydrogenase